MTATLGDIDRYIAEGQTKGARWVIVAVDRWDHCNYPIFVKADEDFWAKYPDGSNMQGCDEASDHQHPSVPVSDQRAERRAHYEPPRGETS